MSPHVVTLNLTVCEYLSQTENEERSDTSSEDEDDEDDEDDVPTLSRRKRGNKTMSLKASAGGVRFPEMCSCLIVVYGVKALLCITMQKKGKKSKEEPPADDEGVVETKVRQRFPIVTSNCSF